MKQFDRIIIGAGIYGLYAAIKSGEKGLKTVVLEYEDQAMQRGTYINQARLHNGYHYPRSISTALKSKAYFERFYHDYAPSILDDFQQIYAISKNFSWTNGNQFQKFCHDANIYCRPINTKPFLQDHVTDGVFETKEYSIDAIILKELMLKQIAELPTVEVIYNAKVRQIEKATNQYIITTDIDQYTSPFVLNATYASTNQILEQLNYPKINIKYELCEVILCHVPDLLKNVGITVMDGPFFSVMPFGKTGLHSLTAVTFTPHVTSYDALPTFSCQKPNAHCSPSQLANCNHCPNQPHSAWEKMYHIAKKYLDEHIELQYVSSLYTIKPILQASEIDDSRPTIIRQYSTNPTFYTVFSGKLNTMYDLDQIL